MEITIVNEYYPPYVTGGTELFLQSLAEFLVAHGHKIKVICTLQDKLKKYEKKEKIEIYRIKSSPIKIGYRYQIPGITFYWNHFNKTVKSKIKKIAKRSDIVYINNSRHLSLAPFQAAKELNKKIIFDVHDYWPICLKKDMFRNNGVCNSRSAWECTKCILSKKKMQILSPILFPLIFLDYYLKEKNIVFDAAICHSEWMTKILPFETKMIPYPLRKKPRKIKSKTLNFPIRLLFVGRFSKQKGVLIFPKIAKLFVKMKVDFKLGFMGSGSLENRLKRELKGVPANFYGWVNSFEKKKEIFSNYHLLLAPSIWGEPFGMVVIEAMSFATPSIVSNYGGLRELVEKNKSGKFVDPKPEKIVETILNLTKKEYKKLSRNCIRNIKKYDKSKILKKYLNFFESNL